MIFVLLMALGALVLLALGQPVLSIVTVVLAVVGSIVGRSGRGDGEAERERIDVEE